MNLVVNFLSKLATDESNGSVKRMLSVCSEFERIAKVVLDRAERDTQAKRKRKAAGDDTSFAETPNEPSADMSQTAGTPSTHAPPPTQHSPSFSYIPNHASRHSSAAGLGGFPAPHPETQPMYQTPAGENIHGGLPKGPVGLNPELSDLLGGPTINQAAALNQDQSYAADSMPIDISAFQQPFVPHDLWQMPMTLEWDWADMPNNGFQFGEEGPR